MNAIHGALVAALAVIATAAIAAPGDTEVVSFNVTTGYAAHAFDYALSYDGRFVTFASSDAITTSVSGYTGYVYVRDRRLRTTQMVSLGRRGELPNDFCYGGDISSDGRFVTMACYATNMIGDGRAAGLVLRDRTTGANTRVADTAREHSAMSGNGRYVVFTTAAALVPGDTNGTDDVYIWDRQTLVSERVSVGYRGGPGGLTADKVDVSDDGRFVAFFSSAADLVPRDTNGFYDVFVRDRLNKVTVRANVSSTGTQANGETFWWIALSGDGHFVTFASSASNLVPGDNNGRPDAFIRDLVTGTTERVNLSPSGGAVAGTGGTTGVSADGRFVAFEASASNLVPNDTNNGGDIFVRDRAMRANELASVSSSGIQTDGSLTYRPVLSGDGRFVAFLSATENWGTSFDPDNPGGSILYIHELKAVAGLPVTLTPSTTKFGLIKVGTRSDIRQVTVRNVSAAAVTLTGIYLGGPSPGQYQRTSHCAEILAVAATCVVDVTFAPTSTGSKTARLFVNIAADPVVKASAWLTGSGL